MKVLERIALAAAPIALGFLVVLAGPARVALAQAGPLEFSGDRLAPLPGPGWAVALDDFNGDGRFDLLATDDRPGSETDSLVVLPGLASGRFGEAQSFSIFPNVVDVVASDFNHDGRPDAAVLTTRVRLFILENRTPPGSATFELAITQFPRLPRSGFQALRLGDSDADGWEDLFLWHPTAPEVLLYRNGGSPLGGFPAFSQEYSFVPETRNFASSFAAEDFTGDRRSDLALLRGDPFDQVRQVEIYRALESPSGEEPPLELASVVPLSGFPGQIASGRIDDDELVDLLVVTDFQRRVELFRGVLEDKQAVGRFVALATVEIGLRQNLGPFSLVDLNGDGRLDILDPEVQAFYREAPTVEEPVRFERMPLPAVQGGSFAVADLDGDSLKDLVSTLGGRSFAGVFPAQEGLVAERPQFGAQNFVDVGRMERLVAAGDFDRDGRNDLAVAIEPADGTGDRVVVLRSLGGGDFEAAGEIPLTGRAEQLEWFDLSGEGTPELVVLQSVPAELSVYGIPLEASPSLLFSVEVASRPRRFHLSDFDGDGAVDLVLAHDGSFSTNEEARLTFWRGLEGGSWIAAGERVVNGGLGLKRLGALLSGDFNADRLRDLAVLNTAQGDETDWLIFFGDGTADLPAYREQAFGFGQGRDPLGFASADLNDDALPDLGFVFPDGFGFVLGEAGVGEEGAFTALEFHPSGEPWQFSGGMAFADLRHTGRPDWIQGIGRVLTFYPHPDEDSETLYAESLSYAGGAAEFALGDFDGDSALDLATVDSQYLRIFLNRTQALPSALPTPTPSRVPTRRPTLTPTRTPTPTSTFTPTSTPSPTPTRPAARDADFDGSGVVDAGDLLLLLRDWRYRGAEPVSDLDRDGAATPGDLFLFQIQWLESR